VQVVPAAWSLAARAREAAESAVLVGDPIYNAADVRRTDRMSAPPEGLQLNRLPASGDEVRACARINAGLVPQVLEGTAATRARFLDAVSHHPSLIHLATHVMTPGSAAFIAFGASRDGRPELLTSSEVATLDVNNALVVMTGCASGTGEAFDGAGLQGLTRAWMTAGASQVIATLWAIPDRGSELMPAFYRYWKEASPAEALRRSQVQMISSGSWQAAPSHWAAFQISGGVR
jgi:CHAT domain-containing protein